MSTDILTWGGNTQEPTEQKTRGYQGGEKPLAEHFNYIFQNFSACIKENRDQIQKNKEDIEDITSRFDGKLIPEEIKALSEITQPGTYIGTQTDDKKYSDAPEYNYGTPPGDAHSQMSETTEFAKNFILEVSEAPDNQTYQSFSFLTSNESFVIFERLGTQSWKNITPKSNKLLWSGCHYMNASQTIDLSSDWKKISNQDKGIVLVFTGYNGDADVNWAWQSFFIPKEIVSNSSYHPGGTGFCFFLIDESCAGVKYLYIHDDRIAGSSTNTKSSDSIGGMTVYNTKFALRYVFGV